MGHRGQGMETPVIRVSKERDWVARQIQRCRPIPVSATLYPNDFPYRFLPLLTFSNASFSALGE